MTAGNRIRRIRLQQELSIRTLAEQAKVSKTSIVRLEAGEPIRPSTILKVAKVLGLHIDRLVSPLPEKSAAFAAHFRTNDAWYDLVEFDKGRLDSKAASTAAKRKQLAISRGITPLNILSSRLENGRIKPTIMELYSQTPIRSHIGEEFVMVLEGEALILIGDSQVTLKQGESVTFWSAEAHGYAPAKGSPLPTRILSVRVDTA